MKQLFLIFVFLAGCCLAASAERIKLVPSASDSTRMDTIVISELSDKDSYDMSAPNDNFDFFGESMSNDMGGIIALISVIMVFGLPLFIVAITLWFRYKNKQAKYKLAAEALAAGRTIPTELFNEPEERENAILAKGIKNIFLGIGLGVLLWVMTEEEGLAAIGFLIFCMGIGQVLIAYTTSPRKRDKEDSFSSTRMNRNEKENRSKKMGNIEMEHDEKHGEGQITKNNTDTTYNDK